MMTEPVSDFDNEYDSGRGDEPQRRPHHQLNNHSDHTNGDINGRHNAPHYMTGSHAGVQSSFFVNGDKHFTAKKIVLNPKYFRDMTHYLDHLTDKLNPKFGAIRKIHTPSRGHRIYDLNDLQPGGEYVAAGSEKFRRIPYDQIVPHERRKSPPYKYDADPVVHSKFFKCSARFGKIENQSIIIKVWPNGGEKKAHRPRVVLLRRTPDWNIGQVIAMVNDMLKADCNGPVDALFDTTGCKLTDANLLEHNGVYVALTKRDRFRRAMYHNMATKDLHISPRPDRKGGLDPLFSRSNNSTSNSSPEHSNASSSQSVPVNGYSRRRPPRPREEDQVFPAKPVKYNRSSEKTRKVDLDKDEGGVFKAKNSNNNTRGAREINDSRHTKVDLPLDQQKARPVDDETPERPREDRSRPTHRASGFTESKTNSRRPPPRVAPVKNNNNNKQKEPDEEFIRDIKRRREQSAIKIQAGYRGYKTRKQLADNKSNQVKGRKNTRQKSPSPVPPPQQNNWTPVSQDRGENSQNTSSPPPAYDFREEERAATKIQAGYRGFVTRKEVGAKKEARRRQNELENYQSIAQDEAKNVADNVEDRYDEEERAATKIQAGFRGFQARKQYQAKAAQDESQSRNREEERAATKIQAGFRGYQARSSLKDRKSERSLSPVQQNPPPPNYDDEDDDEDDEDIYDKAATKIQAGFRGYQVRKSLRV